MPNSGVAGTIVVRTRDAPNADSARLTAAPYTQPNRGRIVQFWMFPGSIMGGGLTLNEGMTRMDEQAVMTSQEVIDAASVYPLMIVIICCDSG
jgi:hypothetical protein